MAVNGRVTRELGTLADPRVDTIDVDGRRLGGREPHRYLVLHKPRGYVTSLRDPAGRPVITDLIRSPERLYPVGRLDADVEGVLLLTNDGALTHRLLHPRYGLSRVYEADVEGRVTRADLPRWRQGVALEDGPACPRAVDLITSGREQSCLRLTFAEGRKHEVKRYCDALGHRVVRLRRVAFGPIRLGDLPRGKSRALTGEEVAALRAEVALRPAEPVAYNGPHSTERDR